MHRQRGYGCGLATGPYVRSRRTVESKKPPFLPLSFIVLPFLIAYHDNILADSMLYLIDQKETGR